MTKKQKVMVCRLLVSAVSLFAGILNEERILIAAFFFALSYLSAGYDIPIKAIRNIKTKQFFDENLLMTIATLGALFVGEPEEAVAVMLFYQVGELFSDYAVNRSRKSITDLMDINPEYANLLKDGSETMVDPYEVAVGDHIIIKPGEKVPLDGVVVSGQSMLDTKALTGETMPVDVEPGDAVISGSINLNGVLEVKAEKLFDDSTVAKILELVENASSRKAKAENFITRFARIYTPIVVVLAVILAVIPPLVLQQPWSVWIYRACSFLVVSCPCALVISVPLSFFGGLGAASKQGILIKGSNYLEALSSLEYLVFDKTGTLTTGKFYVTDISPASGTREQLLELAAYAEYRSNHPIAISVLEEYGKKIDHTRIKEVRELAGQGVAAEILDQGEARTIYVGNHKLMKEQGISEQELIQMFGTTLHVADQGQYLGSITISDKIRPDVPETIEKLRYQGVKKIVMLTGDKESVARNVAEKLKLDQYFGGLLPADKVDKVEQLMAEKPASKMLGFVGDGINDAPVLARADIGIAMGGIGSDAAVEAADVVIMTDEPSKIVSGIRISRKTMVIVKQNIIFAIGVKIVVLILAALGFASMWAAVFADVGVSVLAIINAIRALYDSDGNSENR